MKLGCWLTVLLVLAGANAAGQNNQGNSTDAIEMSSQAGRLAPLQQDHPSDEVWTSGIHPSVDVSAFPPSAGYGFGLTPSVGISLQYTHFMLDAQVGYGFMRKVNDNDQVPNEHGHTRDASSTVYWRKRRNFVGLGASWGETAVTPYRKYSWAPDITAGHDYNLVRITASFSHDLHEYTDYPSLVEFTPGPGQPALSHYCRCGNGTSVVTFNLWESILHKRPAGILLHSSLSMIYFHDTVTDPYNLQLTLQQKANSYFDASLSFGLVIRH